MDVSACVSEASGAYHVAVEQIRAIMANGLPAGIEKDGRVGPMAIPTDWLPLFSYLGISPELVANDACQNVIAGTWILAYQRQLDRSISQDEWSRYGAAGDYVSKDANKRRQQWRYAVNQAALQTGEPVALIEAVIMAESRYQPNARSTAGAIGFMQLMPGTATEVGVNAHNPVQNILGGATYLSRLRRQFGGDLTLMLAAYNAGPANVTKSGYKIPAFAETREYVPRVLSYYRAFLNGR